MANTTASYSPSCLQTLIDSSSSAEAIEHHKVRACANGHAAGEVEEEISYVAGNTLWAFYQFTVVVVLLSILRARMVNTYHRVFKEADVQWKYFRSGGWCSKDILIQRSLIFIVTNPKSR